MLLKCGVRDRAVKGTGQDRTGQEVRSYDMKKGPETIQSNIRRTRSTILAKMIKRLPGLRDNICHTRIRKIKTLKSARGVIYRWM
jgi:hypothetical protein